MARSLRFERPLPTRRWSLGIATAVVGVLLAEASAALAAGQFPVRSSAAPPPAASSSAPDTSAGISNEDLEELVAPIALYPDILLSNVLDASIFPDQLAAAQAMRDAGGDPGTNGDPSWDDSVRFVATFPDVLAMLVRYDEWTATLADAFLFQAADLLAAVQELRSIAWNNGALQSNQQQVVVREGTKVIIEPANPQVIFVPVYTPSVVFVRQPVAPVGVAVISFGVGVAVGAVWVNHWRWGPGWGPVWWGGRSNVRVNVNVNNNRTINVNRPGGGSSLRPDRPSGIRPGEPGRRPDRPGLGSGTGSGTGRPSFDRPGNRPGSGSGAGSAAGGLQRPRPGDLPSRPGGGAGVGSGGSGNRPRPDIGSINRPSAPTARPGGGNRPTARPAPPQSRPEGISRPGGGNVSRPSGGNVSRPSGGNVSRPSGGNVSSPSGGNVSRPSGGNVSRPAAPPSRGSGGASRAAAPARQTSGFSPGGGGGGSARAAGGARSR